MTSEPCIVSINHSLLVDQTNHNIWLLPLLYKGYKKTANMIGTIYEKKANNSGRQLDEVVKFRHFSSNEAAYR